MSAPVLITPAIRAAEVAALWREQYPSDGMLGGGKSSGDIHKELLALGSSPVPEAVNAVIGNDSWTAMPDCDGCGASDLPAVVRVGAEPDYESNTAHLCPPCLLAAIALAPVADSVAVIVGEAR